MTNEPLAAEDDRNMWLGAAILFLGGGISGAVCTVVYLSAAFMGRDSDRTVWQMWLCGSAGLTLAAVATGIIFATVRRRKPVIWLIPAVLLLVPSVLLLALEVFDA